MSKIDPILYSVSFKMVFIISVASAPITDGKSGPRRRLEPSISDYLPLDEPLPMKVRVRADVIGVSRSTGVVAWLLSKDKFFAGL
jgi:hypothetical protein